MASTIVTKNSSTASAVPVSGDLTQGELAVNVTDKRLFTKNSGGTVVELGTNPASLALPNGTANGVLYLNGSKVATSGSALYFDGTNLGVGTTSPTSYVGKVVVNGHQSILGGNGLFLWDSTNANAPSIYAPGDSFAFKNNAGSELMRLTSTGLGIGTSSPTYKLDVQGSAGVGAQIYETSTGTNKRLRITQETAYAKYEATYSSGGNAHSWWNGGTRQMDLDVSGNLGLGVTPSAWNASHPAFQFKYNTAISSYSSNDGLELTSNGYADTATTWKYIESYSAAQYVVGGGQHAWKNAALGTAGAAITWTQAMTLDAGGNLLVGTTSSSGRITVYPASNSQYGAWIASQSSGDVGNAMLVLAKYDNNTTTSQIFAQFRVNSSTLSGYITANGANAATFTSSSDIRLKENIEQLPNQLDNICSLNPVEFDFKDGSGHQIGFIAQEMQNVYSDAVAEGPDGYLMISGWSKTEARLVKAIQEQQALITQLTERITALEGK